MNKQQIVKLTEEALTVKYMELSYKVSKYRYSQACKQLENLMVEAAKEGKRSLRIQEGSEVFPAGEVEVLRAYIESCGFTQELVVYTVPTVDERSLSTYQTVTAIDIYW